MEGCRFLVLKISWQKLENFTLFALKCVHQLEYYVGGLRVDGDFGSDV